MFDPIRISPFVSLLALGALVIPLSAAEPASAVPAAAKESAVEPKPPIVIAENTVVTHDVAYTEHTGDKLRTLDLYVPKGAEGAPVFVFIHGGGWNKRDKEKSDPSQSCSTPQGPLSRASTIAWLPPCIIPKT